MTLLKFCFYFLLLVVLFNNASGLRCYVCDSVSDGSSCRKIEQCRAGYGCENVVRMENGILRISKGCQQFQACVESSRQNSRQCSPSVQSFLNDDSLEETRNLPPSVCRSCCKHDLCNKKLFLQEARAGPRIPGSRTIKLVPSQPSIRDVKVQLLTSDVALITFKDRENHPADFFNVQLQPPRGTRVAPIRLKDHSIPGLNLRIPKGSIAFLARGLSAGTQYRIRAVSQKNKGNVYSQRILKSFVTHPRRPSRIRLRAATVNALRFFVVMPGNKGMVSYYSASYRKASDPPSKEKKIPNFNTLRMQIIRDLMPSTAYVISAWTNIAGRQGRLLGSSSRVNLTVYTAVPPVKEIFVQEVHATSITWGFRLPYYATRNTQDQFLITVRDDTDAAIVVDTTIRSDVRQFTATNLRPQTFYSISIRARSKSRNSEVTRSESVVTLIRCYSCHDATSAEQCDQYIECPANSGGCLNEVRRRSFTNTNSGAPEWYRASLQCKQVTACNNSEIQDNLGMQCEPNRNRNIDPPDVCRCCCEGDLCNGPGNDCGHILGWLTPFRSPEILSSNGPVFCDKPVIRFGSYRCTGEVGRQEIGAECSFSCRPRYELAGEKVLTCLDNGQWHTKVPVCLPRRSCRAIPLANGTTLTCTNGFSSGSTCQAACADGYLLLASESATCRRNGKWDESILPICVAEDDCQPDPCLNGATCHDLPNEYECECLDGWTGRHCETEVFCSKLYSPRNGNLQCTSSNRFGSRCRYTCEEGYEQHGSTYTRCSADGYWTAFERTICVVKTCPIPPLTLVNGGSTECSGYEYGDTCHFTCPHGFAVSGGPENITCGNEEKWSGNFPCCDQKCPPHAKIDLYFLLDSSSSVGRDNWKRLINFTISLLDQFAIGDEDLVVGVGRYNKYFDRRGEISFGDYKDADDLKRKVSRMRYNGDGTNTGRALWHLRYRSLRHPGNRPDVPDVVVVITDGISTDSIVFPSSAIKRERETKIYAIGVVNQFYEVNKRELEQMASGPEYVQIIEDGYEELARRFGTHLARDVCWIPCQYQYETREVSLRERQLETMDGDLVDQEFWSRVDSNSTSVSVAVEPTQDTRPPIHPIEPEIPIEGETGFLEPESPKKTSG